MHNDKIDNQWEIQNLHEERLNALEKKNKIYMVGRG